MTSNVTQVFSGLNIVIYTQYQTQTTEKDIRELQELITYNGGKVLPGLKKGNATHIISTPTIISSLRKNNLTLLRNECTNAKLVNENWVRDSAAQGHLLDEQPYLIELPKLVTKRSQRIQEKSKDPRNMDDLYDYEIGSSSSDDEGDVDMQEVTQKKRPGRPRKGDESPASPPFLKRGRGRPKKDGSNSTPEPTTPNRVHASPSQYQNQMFNFVSYSNPQPSPQTSPQQHVYHSTSFVQHSPQRIPQQHTPPQQPAIYRYPPIPQLPSIMSPAQMLSVPPPPMHQSLPPTFHHHSVSQPVPFRPVQSTYEPPVPTYQPRQRKYNYTWNAQQVVEWLFETIHLTPDEQRSLGDFLTREKFNGDNFPYEIDEQLLKDAGFSSGIYSKLKVVLDSL
jgi:hypothetical protein